MKRALCAWVAAAGLVGCAAFQEEAFDFGERRVRMPPAELQTLRARWSPETRDLTRQSRVELEDVQEVLDRIAVASTGATGLRPCERLHLAGITREPMQAVKRRLPNGEERVVAVPHEFHETWHVDACGVAQRWSVLDDRGRLVMGLYPTR